MSERDSINAGRMYVRALLDRDGRTEPEHEAYAERLVNEHWTASDEGRTVVRVAMEAYFDGHEAGRGACIQEGRELEQDIRAARREAAAMAAQKRKPPAEEAPPAA